MGQQTNTAGAFMPHFESRRASASSLTALGAECVLDVNGDESAVILLSSVSTPNLTYNIQGSADGVNFFDLTAYPYGPATVGTGSSIILPLPSQPLVVETLVGTLVINRMLCASVGGLQKIRVRLTAYTSGVLLCNITSDAAASINPYARDQKAATLIVSATGVAGASVTATLVAVTGLRHYIDRVDVVRSVTALQTATAVPAVVTTSNIPGNPQLTFGTDAAAIGADKQCSLEFGGAGMSVLATGVATTIIAPAVAGVIWRINVFYRLGL